MTVVFATLGITVFFTALFLLKATLSRYEKSVAPFLRKATGHPVRGVAIGAVVTALIQSSSATGAITVGLVGAGWLDLRHAFAIILGANIGTTITGQIIAFQAEMIALPAFFGGFALYFSSKGSRREIGSVIAAISGVFVGLGLLSESLLRMEGISWLQAYVLSAEASPLTAIISGTVLTAAVHSSSAVTGLLISMAGTGVFSVKTAVLASLGSNIGTVTTTLLASIPTGPVGRRVAVMDLLFNVAGVILFLPFISLLLMIISAMSDDPGRQVAHAHTLFNVITVLVMIPFIPALSRFVSIFPRNPRQE